MSSAQAFGVPVTHPDAGSQRSPVVQASPSSQTASIGSWAQVPVAGSQESDVQLTRSLQSRSLVHSGVASSRSASPPVSEVSVNSPGVSGTSTSPSPAPPSSSPTSGTGSMACVAGQPARPRASRTGRRARRRRGRIEPSFPPRRHVNTISLRAVRNPVKEGSLGR